MLLMSMIADFGSHDVKTDFKAHAGFSYSDIFNAAVDFEKKTHALHVKGTVTITAHQDGGDPT